MLRKTVTVAGTALGLALLGGATAQATSSVASGTVTHIHLTEKYTDDFHVQKFGKKPDQIGNYIAFADDAVMNGKTVGLVAGTCQRVRIYYTKKHVKRGVTDQCVTTVSIGQSQLTLQGLQTYYTNTPASAPRTIAITGGTGKYRLARGQATFRLTASGDGESVDIALVTD